MPHAHARVVLLIIDQLAGHWAQSAAPAATTHLPPPNVMDYHAHGLIPHISACINNGFWTLRPLNQGKCMTPYGLRYLASGRYDSDRVKLNDDWYAVPYADGLYHTINEWIDLHRPDLQTATFGSGNWVEPGYFHTRQHCIPLPGYFPDSKELTDYVFPYMAATPNWNLVVIYLPEHDLTAKPYGIPVWVEKPEKPTSDKHHHLIDYVDVNVGWLVDYLTSSGWWDETLLIITSDHAYHYGCDAMSLSFRPNGGPHTGTELCWDHVYPWDCKVWDFAQQSPTTEWSDCCRRITQIVTGGALPAQFRGLTRATGDICDATATVAATLGIPYTCAGLPIINW